MNKIVRIIFSIFGGIFLFITLISFSKIAQGEDFGALFFITIFSLILIIAVTKSHKNNITEQDKKKLNKFFWLIFITDLIFLFYIGTMYLSNLTNFGIFFFYKRFASDYTLLLATFSFLFSFFFYYLMSNKK